MRRSTNLLLCYFILLLSHKEHKSASWLVLVALPPEGVKLRPELLVTLCDGVPANGHPSSAL